MRTFLLVALAAVLLTACATRGIPLEEAPQALDNLERCSHIERASCGFNRSGFRGETNSPARERATVAVPYGSYGYDSFALGGYGTYGAGFFGGGRPFPVFDCRGVPGTPLPPSCGLHY